MHRTIANQAGVEVTKVGQSTSAYMGQDKVDHSGVNQLQFADSQVTFLTWLCCTVQEIWQIPPCEVAKRIGDMDVVVLRHEAQVANICTLP